MAALTKITDKDLLEKVKSLIGISGTNHDEAVKILIQDVKFHLIDAGVNEVAVNSNAAIGAIARGVDDMWNLGSGTVNLSQLYKDRETSLALAYPKDESISHVESEEVDA